MERAYRFSMNVMLSNLWILIMCLCFFFKSKFMLKYIGTPLLTIFEVGMIQIMCLLLKQEI